MNAVLYLNLLEILGEDQLKMLNFKITMCRNAVNTMLINIKIGKDSDKQTFQQFKRNINESIFSHNQTRSF